MARATASAEAPPRSIPRRVAAGFFAAAAPDLDFVIGFVGPVEYLLTTAASRTRSFYCRPGRCSFVAAGEAPARARRLARALRRHALALLTHIVGDLITSFGTMILAPFSDWRAAIGTTFIIDLWFSGIIVAGLIASAVFYNRRFPAVAASVVLAGYVGFQYVQKERAVELGEQHATSLGLKNAKVSVHPRPVSPFNWTVFVSDDEAHRYAHVNLVRKEPRRYQPGDGFIARIDSPYMPVEQAIWVTRPRYGATDQAAIRDAWNSEELAVLPLVRRPAGIRRHERGSTCVWFTDLRFPHAGARNDAVPLPRLPRQAGCGLETGYLLKLVG